MLAATRMDKRALRAILRAAKALLAPSGHWTKGELARDAVGAPVEPHSPLAICWCLEGALKKVTRSDQEYKSAVSCLMKLNPWQALHRINDACTTSAPVLALLSKGIASCRYPTAWRPEIESGDPSESVLEHFHQWSELVDQECRQKRGQNRPNETI